MMLKVGLTGGIGSGKTYISKVFRELGVPVYEADAEARRLMAEDTGIRDGILRIFGEEVFNGINPDRKKIADRVFTSGHLLSELNGLIHPAVENDFLQWLCRQKGSSYVIKEAAILFESGSAERLDKVILVVSDEKTRIRRVVERDQVSEADVLRRVRNQMIDEEKIKLADFIIYNNNDSMILKQIVDLHEKFLRKEIL